MIGLNAASESLTYLKQRLGQPGRLVGDKVAQESALSSQFSVEELGLSLRTENRELRTSESGFLFAVKKTKAAILSRL
jgi:hypothetical protein